MDTLKQPVSFLLYTRNGKGALGAHRAMAKWEGVAVVDAPNIIDNMNEYFNRDPENPYTVSLVGRGGCDRFFRLNVDYGAGIIRPIGYVDIDTTDQTVYVELDEGVDVNLRVSGGWVRYLEKVDAQLKEFDEKCQAILKIKRVYNG